MPLSRAGPLLLCETYWVHISCGRILRWRTLLLLLLVASYFELEFVRSSAWNRVAFSCARGRLLQNMLSMKLEAHSQGYVYRRNCKQGARRVLDFGSKNTHMPTLRPYDVFYSFLPVTIFQML